MSHEAGWGENRGHVNGACSERGDQLNGRSHRRSKMEVLPSFGAANSSQCSVVLEVRLPVPPIRNAGDRSAKNPNFSIDESLDPCCE